MTFFGPLVSGLRPNGFELPLAPRPLPLPLPPLEDIGEVCGTKAGLSAVKGEVLSYTLNAIRSGC